MNDKELFIKKRRHDSMAKWFISFIGIGTIVSVMLIILVIFLEILPLFTYNKLVKKAELELSEPIIASSMGPWFEKALTLNIQGKVLVYDLKSKSIEKEISIAQGQESIESVEQGLDQTFTLRWSGNTLSRVSLGFKPTYDNNSARTIVFNPKLDAAQVQFKEPLSFGLSRKSADGMTLFVGLTQQGKVLAQTITTTENFLGEVEESKNSFTLKYDQPIAWISANKSGNRFYSLSKDGLLEFWDVRADSFHSRGHVRLNISDRQVIAFKAMVGIDEVAITYRNGEVEVVALASVDGDHLKPEIIHSARVSDLNITNMMVSPRNRTLFFVSEGGALTAWYSTNQRTLIATKLEAEIQNLHLSARGHGLSILQDNKRLSLWHWDSPHPEAGFKAFFGKIWYAGYPEPDYSWQSSSSSDDFEPKISLVPLIYGSIKGAIYAMLFSVPLSVFAALYTSVFAGTKVRAIIKPVVEMMSAIPSVVVGFLGALWLSPLIDNHLLEVVIALPIGLLVLAFLPKLMGQVRGKDLMMLKPGTVLMVSGVGILLSFLIGLPVSRVLESTFFNGYFRTWLVETMGINYEMRNSVIIGITLGFAVIPIIYTISEDSISSVPRGLISASLALGATPWQTAWRVVLPAASPGIFAAITLGLGRAVGETMIVLMATGNTPIMNASIFEGFRALSANIAVEMPEAPVGGTLFRTLFLSAGVLLIFTSCLNTITEMIRHRLAKTYSKL